MFFISEWFVLSYLADESVNLGWRKIKNSTVEICGVSALRLTFLCCVLYLLSVSVSFVCADAVFSPRYVNCLVFQLCLVIIKMVYIGFLLTS